MRPLLIFGGMILAMALLSLFFLMEVTTGFAKRFWNNWLFVQESRIQGDLPWTGPGRQAKFYLKYRSNPNNVITKVPEWGADPRRTSGVHETAARVSGFLKTSGFAAPRTASAPCRFFIVSLDPVIVVMLQSVPNGPNPPPVPQQESPIEYGTHLPPGISWEWFSPDLNRPPAALPLDGNVPASIHWPGGELVFHPDGKGWRVERR